MPASLTISPPPLVFSRDPVWLQVQTGVAVSLPASAIFVFSSTGPSDGQTLRLQWAGRDLTFTAKTTPDATNAFEWPLFSGTLAAYAEAIAEKLRGCEAVTDYFDVQVVEALPDYSVALVQKVREPVTVTVTDTMTNVGTFGSTIPGPWAEDNLRLLLQVWQQGDVPENDVLLATFHAPYRTSDRAVDLDISSAFSELLPALPGNTSMNDVPPYAGNHYGQAGPAWMAYYVRYADKYGNPAQTRSMTKSTGKFALYGATAGDSQTPSNISVRHNYRGRDLQPYRKPVVCDQPDWVYVWTGEIEPDTVFWLSVFVRFDDGQTQTIAVTESDLLQPNTLYWFVSGFKQLGLDTVVIPSGATRIEEYDWRIYPADESDVPMFGPVRYRVENKNDYDWFLIFDNGVTGCETVNLRGPKQSRYETGGDVYEVERTPEWTVRDSDYRDYNKIGRKSWEASTGLYDRKDPYVEHLLQLPLSDAWLLDQASERYLRVRVEGRDLQFDNNADTQVSLTFTIRAAWRDPAYNM